MQYSSEPPASFISNADDNISEGKEESQEQKNKSKQKHFPNLRSYVTDSHQESSGLSNFQLLNHPKKYVDPF